MSVKVTLVVPNGGDTVIAISDTENDVVEAKITRAMNSASSASLVFPASNVKAAALATLNHTIAIYNNDVQMFVGSVNGGVKTDIWGRVTLDLDGALAWLNDVSKAPFSVSAAANKSVAQYLTDIVTQYNSGVKENRQIVLGGVTVSGNVVVDHHEEYTKTSDLVRELLENHGGFITETYQGGILKPRIDYFATPLPYGQPVKPLEFGKDIIDFEKVIDFSDYASRVYAVGNGGITASAINADAEKAWGRVDYPYKSNAETQAALQAEVNALLAAKSVPLTTVTSTAHGAANFVPGTVYPVIDYRSKIDAELLVYGVELDLIHPENNRVTFGKAAPKTFTNTRNLRN